MAWNPSPKVADCREIARKWGKQQVIVLAVDPVAGTLEMATYGQTKKLCAEASRLGNAAWKAIMDNYEDEVLPGAKLAAAPIQIDEENPLRPNAIGLTIFVPVLSATGRTSRLTAPTFFRDETHRAPLAKGWEWREFNLAPSEEG